MELNITNNRICAGMPGHKLCLDYQLPAVQKIVARFLKQHPLISAYKDCHFSKISKNSLGSSRTITCSSDPYHVSAEEQKIPGFFDPSSTDTLLIISLSKDGMGKFEALECDKNGCKASIYNGYNIPFQYSFHHFLGGICSEVLHKRSNTRQSNNVPCDGRAIRFDEYLKHSTFSLGVPQPVQPPQSQYGQASGSPSAFGNAPSQPGSAVPRQSIPQNPPSFPSLPAVLGVVSTIFCLYKTYKELEKIDEEGHRDQEASRVNPRERKVAQYQDGSGNKASGWRALGYLAGAVASGAFTAYNL